MSNPLLQQRKPTNPQSVLWVIFTLLLAICLWLLFERLSPVTKNSFEEVQETKQETQQEPQDQAPTGVTSSTGSTDTNQVENDLDNLNEDLDFSENDLRDSEFRT